jgi:hypothetical protein
MAAADRVRISRKGKLRRPSSFDVNEAADWWRIDCALRRCEKLVEAVVEALLRQGELDFSPADKRSILKWVLECVCELVLGWHGGRLAQ